MIMGVSADTNKASERNFFRKLRSLTVTELTYAIGRRCFYIYPIRLLSPLFFAFVWLLILIASPWKKIIISFLISERIGHLAIDVDLFVRKKQLTPSNKTYIFFFRNTVQSSIAYVMETSFTHHRK